MGVRLTELSHGGGCGCKIDPAVLSDMLAALPQAGASLQTFPICWWASRVATMRRCTG